MGAVRAFAGGVSKVCDHVAGWLLLALVLLNGASVFMRYVVGDSISWSEEGIRYFAVWITFLGSVAASWHDEHLDMNLFAGIESPVFQGFHRCLLHLLNVAFSAVVAWQGWIYCALNGAQTAPTTGLPMIYVYGAIALGGVLLTLVHLVKALDAALSVRGA